MNDRENKALLYKCAECGKIFKCWFNGIYSCQGCLKINDCPKNFSNSDVDYSHGFCPSCQEKRKESWAWWGCHTEKRKWFWIFVFLLLLLRMPLADFLVLSDTEQQTLVVLSTQVFFSEFPKCTEAEISIMTDGVELLIAGSCVRWKPNVEI